MATRCTAFLKIRTRVMLKLHFPNIERCVVDVLCCALGLSRCGCGVSVVMASAAPPRISCATRSTVYL